MKAKFKWAPMVLGVLFVTLGVIAGVPRVLNTNMLADSFTGEAASGSNSFAVLTNGSRVDFGAGASDYASSDGTTVTYAGPLASASTISSSKASGSSAFSLLDGALINLSTGDSSAYLRRSATDTVEVAGKLSVIQTIASTSELTIFSHSLNGLLSVGTGAGFVTGPQAVTITGLTMYVSVQSSSTAATTVFTVSDGTNTCTATFTCDGSGIGSLQGAGAKRVTTVNGAGTGCVYAASRPLTFAISTQGCAVAATITNTAVVGKWQ